MADLLRVEGLTKRFGGLLASDGIELIVEEDRCHAVIGPNGAGKTTLIGQLAGTLAPDAGRIVLAGRDITRLADHRRVHLGLARSFQITSLFPAFSAATNLALAIRGRGANHFSFWRRASQDRRLSQAAHDQLRRVGLADRATVPAAALSHGEQRRLELAMALAGRPRLLLLDEPMAGLGPEEGLAMTELLAGLKSEVTILLVEHDMDAVFRLADRITVLNEGRVISSGSPDEIRRDPAVRRAYLGEWG